MTQSRNKNLIVSSSLSAAIRFRGGSLPQINNNTNFNTIDNENNTNNDKTSDKVIKQTNLKKIIFISFS